MSIALKKITLLTLAIVAPAISHATNYEIRLPSGATQSVVVEEAAPAGPTFTAEESQTAWSSFLSYHGATYTTAGFSIRSIGIANAASEESLYAGDGKFPNEALPDSVFTGNIFFDNNNLTQINGLSGLVSADHLFIYNNALVNVDSLSSLTTLTGNLRAYGNQLTNVDGLSSLSFVNGAVLLYDNKLTNIDGLSSLAFVGGTLDLTTNALLTDVSGIASVATASSVALDARDYSVKAPANSPFCLAVGSGVALMSGYAVKAQLCEA